MSFRDDFDYNEYIASADEMDNQPLRDEYDDPAEHPASHFDALRVTDHICEANLLLVNAGAAPLTPSELQLQALAFSAGVSAERFAREVMDDRRRLNGPDGVAA